MSVDEGRENWLSVALRPDILRRGLRVALLVGTILALINHGGSIVRMQLDWESLIKIGLTYLVPFCVSTFASVQTARGQG